MGRGEEGRGGEKRGKERSEEKGGSDTVKPNQAAGVSLFTCSRWSPRMDNEEKISKMETNDLHEPDGGREGDRR